MLLDLNTGIIENISRHIDTLVAAYQDRNNEIGIILFDKLNFLIRIMDFNIMHRCDKISIFIPFLKDYHFEELEYFLDYMIRNDYINDYEDIYIIVNKDDWFEYKNKLNKLKCTVIKCSYSKCIPNELGWVIHDNNKHYRGYNLLIKNCYDTYTHHVKYKNLQLNILGIK